MMIELTDLLLGINTAFIVGLCVHYFKSNYTIMDRETYNQVVDICEDYKILAEEKEQMDGGAEGFFREYLEDDIEEDDDAEEEDVQSEPEEKETPKKKRGRKASKEEDKKVVSDKKVGF